MAMRYKADHPVLVGLVGTMAVVAAATPLCGQAALALMGGGGTQASLLATLLFDAVLATWGAWALSRRKWKAAVHARPIGRKEVAVGTLAIAITWACGTVFSTWVATEFPETGVASAESMSDTLGWAYAAMACTVAPAAEELAFRGAMFSELSRTRLGPLWAAILTAAAFAVTHGTALQLTPAFALGLAFAWLVARTGVIWPSILAHAGCNAMSLAASGVEVPGALMNAPVACALVAMAVGMLLALLAREQAYERDMRRLEDEADINMRRNDMVFCMPVGAGHGMETEPIEKGDGDGAWEPDADVGIR